jgi:hypothetical protein
MSRVRRWLPVALWIAVIYAAIPLARTLNRWFAERWDLALLTWLVIGTIVAGTAGAAALLVRRLGRLRPGALPWIIAIVGILALWAWSLRRSPEEAVHLPEYGVLAVLLWRALRPAVPDATVFVVGALVGCLVGTVDEIIQWLTPERFWDWRDVALNGGAGALVQLLLWRIDPRPRVAISAGSVRFVLRLVAAQLLLVGLCLANTPARVALYAPLLPGGETLMRSHNPMAEYGHRHEIEGLGVFFSRLTLAELAAEDAARGAEVGALVDDWRGDRYFEFLETWPFAEDPFTYELRVHLFARDRNLGRARQRDFAGAEETEWATIAWFENRLVERIFPSSFDHSSYRWPPGLERRVEAIRDPDHRFVSAAGSHLITVAPEPVVLGVIVGLAALLLVADRAVGRYHGGRS